MEIGGGFGGKGMGGGLPGAGGRRALAQDGAAGEAHHVPNRGVRGDGPHRRRPYPGEDGRHEGRTDHRGGSPSGIRGGRLPGLAGGHRLPDHVPALRHSQRLYGGVRRRRKHPKDGGLPCPRLARVGLRRRVGYRRAQRKAIHGPHRVPSEERLQGGYAAGGRPDEFPHRQRRDASGRPGAPSLRYAPGRAQSRPGRRQWGLVQRVRAGQRGGQRQPRRHGESGGGRPRHRWQSSRDGDARGRGAGRRSRGGEAGRWRHRFHRLQLRSGRKPA